MTGRPEIVLVDDEPRVTQSLEREIRLEAGDDAFTITSFNNPENSISYITEHQDTVFLVISDLRMPEMNGSELLIKLRQSCPELQTVLLTAYTDIDNIQRAVSASIQGLLFKPWTHESIIAEISKAHAARKLQEENRLLKRRIDDMLRSAGDFQQSLLALTIPESQRVSFDIAFRPHEEYHCGGDFYDIIECGDERYMTLLGDVTGHGPKPAMIAAMLSMAIHSVTNENPQLRTEPDLLLKKLNDYFCALLSCSPETLVALTAVFVDTKARSLAVATAGMPPVVHIRDGKPELISTPNRILGGFPDTPFYKTERFLNPGDVIFLATDGLVEVVQSSFHATDDAVAEIFTGRRNYRTDSIIERFREILPEKTFTDDVTVIAMTIEGTSGI
jgi:sigma-B regulation protein RsbU (phosphoserine phosphatase)